MSKIFEALEHARRDVSKHNERLDDDFLDQPDLESYEPAPDPEPQILESNVIVDLHTETIDAETADLDAEPRLGFAEEDEPAPRKTLPPPDYRLEVEDAILALYQHIDVLLPLSTRRVIQFIGPQGEEDVSAVARGFAYVAVKSGRSVLLIEGDEKNHNQERFFNIRTPVSSINATKNGKTTPGTIHRIGDLPLYISTSAAWYLSRPAIALPKAFEAFLGRLNPTYDLVVVDSSPAEKTNDGLLLSPMVDGVVLVVEANRTLGSSAEEIKNRISRSGGNLLGVAVSRERHYLPKLLARFLFPRLGK